MSHGGGLKDNESANAWSKVQNTQAIVWNRNMLTFEEENVIKFIFFAESEEKINTSCASATLMKPKIMNRMV